MPPLRAFVLALLAAAPWLAAAQPSVFVCVDSRGRTISGDRPPAECADRQIRELRADGSVRRVIEPPLTPEQRAAREAELARQRDLAERQRAQARRDLALLETYSTDKEIESARKRALADRQVLIERATRRMEELRREKKKLDDESEFYIRRQLPDKLNRAIAANDELMRAQEKQITDTLADMERVNQRYQAEINRFRELIAAGARPVQRKVE
jgi:hypothetical protein